MTVLQIVNYVIDNFGKTKNYFANEIGMSSTTVWRQLKGEQALSSKLIEGVLTAYPEVSVWKAKYDELESIIAKVVIIFYTDNYFNQD